MRGTAAARLLATDGSDPAKLSLRPPSVSLPAGGEGAFPLTAAPRTASTQHSRDPPRRVVRQRNRAHAKGADPSAFGARLCSRARRFRAAAPVQACSSSKASTSVHSKMATTTSPASTGLLSNAGDRSMAGEGGACLPTQTWMPERGARFLGLQRRL
eukprot:scaffold73592_cov66-Phaeocystis_antarctica.AAC.1